MYYNDADSVRENYIGRKGNSSSDIHRNFLILSLFEDYVNASLFQWNRIVENRRAEYQKLQAESQNLDESSKEVKNARVDRARMIPELTTHPIFWEIHFFLVSGDLVQKLFENLAEKDGGEDLLSLWDTYKPKFKSLNDMRNNLEHIDERFKSKFLKSFGNLGDLGGPNCYTFGGESLDLAETVDLIRSAYEQVIRTLQARA